MQEIDDEQPYEFHTTFIDILIGLDPLDEKFKKIEKLNYKFNYDILPKTFDSITKIAPILMQSIKKEQELIETAKDYYIARDILDNTIYACFKELMMIDIDVYRNSDPWHKMDDVKVVEHFSKIQDKSFMIYKSLNGYHVFCTSHKVEYYRSEENVEFMLKNYCDYYYCIFSYIRGYCVRLNKKFHENSESSYSLLASVGKEEIINTDLVNLVEMHNNLSIKYKDIYKYDVI